jgi:hypothetical protein
MALQLGALRDALLDAGAAPDKANKAAEELASYETRLGGIESDLRLLKWMVGGIYVLMSVVIIPGGWLLLRVAAKVGALAT